MNITRLRGTQLRVPLMIWIFIAVVFLISFAVQGRGQTANVVHVPAFRSAELAALYNQYAEAMLRWDSARRESIEKLVPGVDPNMWEFSTDFKVLVPKQTRFEFRSSSGIDLSDITLTDNLPKLLK